MCVNHTHSSPVNIDLSVPQGSINGPIYFTCYSSTLSTTVGDGHTIVGYAEDHSIYSSFEAGNTSSEINAITNLSSTRMSIKYWMHANRLKMNDDKSEFTIFGSSRLLPKANTTEVTVGNIPVERSNCVKLLGVFMDENLNLKHHISMKARAASLAMFDLRKLNQYLDRTIRLKLANATVFSHIDYCNSLFINLPQSTLKPLQRVQNLNGQSNTWQI